MITENQLIQHAQTRGITNRGHAEQDYLQDIILHAISRHTGTSLIFKGGTALAKLHGLDRFSEDLDFTARNNIDHNTLMQHISNELDRYSADHTRQQIDQGSNGIHHRFKIKGPLHQGSDRSLCSIHIDINTDSTAHNYSPHRLHPPYPDIPSFQLSALSREEIAAEKIRAILTRDQPRDIYDLHFLLQQDVKPSKDLINDKLQYYSIEWDLNDFNQALTAKQQSWGTHLPQLVHGPLPDFSNVTQTIQQTLAPANL